MKNILGIHVEPSRKSESESQGQNHQAEIVHQDESGRTRGQDEPRHKKCVRIWHGRHITQHKYLAERPSKREKRGAKERATFLLDFLKGTLWSECKPSFWQVKLIVGKLKSRRKNRHWDKDTSLSCHDGFLPLHCQQTWIIVWHRDEKASKHPRFPKFMPMHPSGVPLTMRKTI